MAKQTINIGASPNDGTGTPLRTAFDYCNLNFTELYTATGPSGNNIVVPGNATITGDLTVDTTTLKVVAASDVVGINTASPLTGNDAGLTIGAIGTVKALNIGLQNTFARLREKDAIDAFAITTNITGSNNQDDATKSSWKVRFGFGNGNDNFLIGRSNVGSTTFQDIYSVSATSAVWSDGAGGTRMTLNSTGLGVGVTPSAWVTFKAIQHPALSLASYSTTEAYYSQNAYNDGIWRRVAAGYASQYIQVNSEHRFLTAGTSSAGSSITFTQAMTLDASGNLLLACTSAPTGSTSGFYFDATHYAYFSRSAGETLNLNRYTSTGATAKFRYAGTEVGDISVTGAGTTYNSTSDYRLKEAIQPLVGGLARVSALKPSIYKWKSNGSNGEGFLAHELAEVVPAAVTGEKDAVNEDGSIKAQSIDMSRIVPILVAAIQELAAEVNALKKA